jgi:hypothetical protein
MKTNRIIKSTGSVLLVFFFLFAAGAFAQELGTKSQQEKSKQDAIEQARKEQQEVKAETKKEIKEIERDVTRSAKEDADKRQELLKEIEAVKLEKSGEKKQDKLGTASDEAIKQKEDILKTEKEVKSRERDKPNYGKADGQKRAEEARLKRDEKHQRLENSAKKQEVHAMEAWERLRKAREELEAAKVAKKISEQDYKEKLEKIERAEMAAKVLYERVQKAKEIQLSDRKED